VRKPTVQLERLVEQPGLGRQALTREAQGLDPAVASGSFGQPEPEAGGLGHELDRQVGGTSRVGPDGEHGGAGPPNLQFQPSGHALSMDVPGSVWRPALRPRDQTPIVHRPVDTGAFMQVDPIQVFLGAEIESPGRPVPRVAGEPIDECGLRAGVLEVLLLIDAGEQHLLQAPRQSTGDTLRPLMHAFSRRALGSGVCGSHDREVDVGQAVDGVAVGQAALHVDGDSRFAAPHGGGQRPHGHRVAERPQGPQRPGLRSHHQSLDGYQCTVENRSAGRRTLL
jgi:hypothetical protein